MTYFWSESITLIRPSNIPGKNPRDVFKHKTLCSLRDPNGSFFFFRHLHSQSVGSHHLSLHLSLTDTITLTPMTTVFVQIISLVPFQSCLSLYFPLFSQLERASRILPHMHPSAPNTVPSLVLAACIAAISIVTWENVFSSGPGQKKPWVLLEDPADGNKD